MVQYISIIIDLTEYVLTWAVYMPCSYKLKYIYMIGNVDFRNALFKGSEIACATTSIYEQLRSFRDASSLFIFRFRIETSELGPFVLSPGPANGLLQMQIYVCKASPNTRSTHWSQHLSQKKPKLLNIFQQNLQILKTKVHKCTCNIYRHTLSIA